ncbi:sodium:proton antiporter [Rhizobium leguminosarum]|uniref:Sodium:proton antiporter n=2 Tax=Rhizobium TaxID=379 RepID=A0A4Q8XRE9_RHILE|nr:sodium:proton antiporter [Rhizobium leguminosarum]TAX63369.1 sodium:proton antiporter [Rhizobium leguminosarum]TAX63425.1 sodium:proton antiporter [Rhizobium leguminosarum]TAX63655.1 sodium:proton antiporter [Rhizobium leguminosarum]TAX64458.1 sodium:proton antiporter [Rhizobium leguminosarum]
MSVFDLISLLLVLTAGFAWVNHRYLRLPPSIGILVMGLAASALLVLLELSIPNVSIYVDVAALVRQVDFQTTVMNGLLAFLLFAGSLHVDFSALRSRVAVVGAMATMGVLLSTVIVGVAMWALAALLGLELPFLWALVFGALISPTDPVAVLSTLKAIKVPQALETDMAGESLFNDGVGVVVFTALLALASDGADVGAAQVAELFVVEALGGAVVGLVSGYAAYRAMRAIDDYPVEVLISIALAMGCYSLASALHMSGPIAVVVAGILVGNRGPKDALSDMTQRYLFGFWTLVDQILNSVLFLLIGLEVLVLRYETSILPLALAAIPVALAARFASTIIPVTLLRRQYDFVRGTVIVLVWGGLRGGISIALALSLPETPFKAALLAATYAVVIFTIVVQGLTLGKVASRSLRASGPSM